MPRAKPVVAVLDDEMEMRKALRRLLTIRGYAVEEFRSGREFLGSLDVRPLDCLLLDLHMPELDGFGVLAHLRSREIHPPVIVITAHDEPGMEQRVFSSGAAGYLKKPVERESLLAAIEQAIRDDACRAPTMAWG